jgi:hypothetical protein
MRVTLVPIVALTLFLVGCGRSGDRPNEMVSPIGPTAVTEPSSTPGESMIEVPFRSEIVWEKTMTGVPTGHCSQTLPEGLIYLWLTHNEGIAVSSHLGTGAYENYLCVFGSVVEGKPAPQGWYAESIRWTAANGDVLLATSVFQRWTGTPGKSIAIDNVTFHDGGTGRFQFAAGEGTAYVNAPARTALYEGALRYGRKEK